MPKEMHAQYKWLSGKCWLSACALLSSQISLCSSHRHFMDNTFSFYKTFRLKDASSKRKSCLCGKCRPCADFTGYYGTIFNAHALSPVLSGRGLFIPNRSEFKVHDFVKYLWIYIKCVKNVLLIYFNIN